MGRIGSWRRRARRRPVVVGITALALLTGWAGMSYGAPYRPDIPKATLRALHAINSTAGVPDAEQNLVPGALAERDAALAAWRAAGPGADPLSKPEYVVVWAGKMSTGDVTGAQLARASSGAVNPKDLARLAGIGMK